MTVHLTRRNTLVAAGSFVFASASSAYAQLQQDILVASGDISSNYTLANCSSLQDAKAEINSNIAAVNGMTDIQLLDRLNGISDELRLSASKRAEAVEASEEAIAATAADIEAKSLKAVRLANDLQLATAVQTRNPQIVGAAAGTHVLVGTGVFAYQAIQATSSDGVINAGVVLSKDRMAMMTIIKSGPGVKLAKKQVALTYRLFTVSGQITKGIADLRAFKAELRELKAALDDLEASISGLPATAEDTRNYFRSHLETERLIYDLLDTVYGGSDCQIPTGGTTFPLG